MDRLEESFYQVDFSQYTDLKDRLAARLFGAQSQKTSSKVVPFKTFARLSEDDLELVNAAQGDPQQKPGLFEETKKPEK